MGNGKRLARILKQYQSGKITKEYLKQLLKSGVLGKVTGIIGPFVVRYQNGKPIVSERPLFVKKSMSTASVQGRNNFASKVKFAKFLNNIPEIREIWENPDIKGCSSYSRLIKHNNIKNTLPTLSNIITPGKYHFNIDAVCSLDRNYNLIISRNSQTECGGTLLALIMPYNPVSRNFEMIFVKAPADSDEIILREEQKEICKKYRNFIVYQTVIRKKENTVEWSNTISAEIFIPAEKTTRSEKERVLFWLLIANEFLSEESAEKHRQRIYYSLRL